MRRSIIIKASALLLQLAGCGPGEQAPPPEIIETKTVRSVAKIDYKVVNRYPHDRSAFTEGLLFYGDKLLESTGDVDHLPQTRSVIGEVDLVSGKLDVKAELNRDAYFGEGIAVLKNRIYQLTLEGQTGFIYDAGNYSKLGQFTFPSREGWGMTSDGRYLIMSDGTYNLTWLDPENNFSVVKTLPVTREGYGLDRLNELEFINGFIFANVWMTNTIVKIDAASGEVTGEIDLTPLYREAAKAEPKLSEMNGIAYDPKSDRIFVTGKMWPYIFELSFPH